MNFRQQHIVSTALQQFYQHGFHATGVDGLSDAAGVTKKTLYRYFASKELLIAAALKWRHAQFLAQMRAFVEAQAVLQRPLAYVDFLLDWVQQADFYGCAFINAAAEYADAGLTPHQLAAAHKAEIRSDLTRWCQAAGVLAFERLARRLFLLGEGLVVASQVAGADAALLEEAQQSAQVFWQTEPRANITPA